MKNEILEYLKGKIEDKYGDLTDNGGCYVKNNEGVNEWLSVQALIDIIDNVDDEY